jgi:ribulose-phosphate 3-epimerase
MIVPALLTDQAKKMNEMGRLCASFCDYVQLDIMDGIFVPSKSVTAAEVAAWKPPLKVEAHLMVVDPIAWIEPFACLGAEKIIYHFEIEADHKKIITAIREKGIRPGLAVNPETPVSDFAHLVDSLDTILFMSVNPGFYGAKFIPEVLEKIAAFRKFFPAAVIAIDGGIKLNNALLAKKAGADHICVGSAILSSDDPKAAYADFTKIIYA